MPTMPPEAMSRPKPKMPHAANFLVICRSRSSQKPENRKFTQRSEAIVTGASSGIGRSIALALGHAGASVCVNYVAAKTKPKAMVDELRGHGHTGVCIQS